MYIERKEKDMPQNKTAKNTQKPLSDGAKKALALIKEHGALTIADMKKLGFKNANSSHLTALKRRGLVDSETVEIEVQVIQKRKVQKYRIK